jgi:putative thiamine transport system permease protein
MIQALPRLAMALFTLPMLGGLVVGFVPAFDGGFAELAVWPGLFRASVLSVGTGLGATVLSLLLTGLIVAMLHDRPAFAPLRRMLSPLLAVPHAAAALGLAFLLAPSGWIARLLSPWATGWHQPPDLLTLHDPMGLALMLGLVAKEMPFLLLMALAALPACAPAPRLLLGAALGHGRLSAFAIGVWPPLYARLRLPVMAVLAYGMTTVEMGMILGPGLPPTLSVQIAGWLTDAGLRHLPLASAAAIVQLALVLAAMGLWRGAEWVGRAILRHHIGRGWRAVRADAPARLAAMGLGFGLAGLLALSLAGLGLWSVAGDWRFPAALPQSLTMQTWARALPALGHSLWLTAMIALGATGLALAVVIASLQAEHSHGLMSGRWAERALYLPLLLPQIAVMPGLQVIALRLGVEGTPLAVMVVHLFFVLPYVFLSLAPAFRGWDRRHSLAAATLGAGEGRIFWRLRLPMLLGPVLTAAALGVAVSAGQYLPTLMVGGGRVGTLTTEAVALSSGGNRRLIGVFAIAQLALPAVAFALALAVPRQVFANRRAMLAEGGR